MIYTKDDITLRVQFYPHGDEGPVKDYLETLRRDGQRRKAHARLLVDIDILAQEGLNSDRVSVRSLGQGLWELRRMYQGVFYRILFCVHEREAWLLHAFEKETRKTPRRDLELARGRFAQLAAGR